jgi:rubredoxin
MACQFAAMLDENPFGVGPRRRPLVAHVTCPTCGGHHAQALGMKGSGEYPLRAAERSSTAPAGSGAPTTAEPTHQCRDCGHLWSEDNPLPS